MKENQYKYQTNRYLLIIGFFLSAIIIAVYWQVLYQDFLYFDDGMYITDKHVQSGWTIEGIIWAFSDTHTSHWHPITWFSHMLDFQLYGLNPAGHHWTNLLFHIVNTLLLLTILHKTTGRLWESVFVASLFALHPLNVESVAWVAERKNVLSTFFWILTMWFYIYYVQRPGILRYMMVFSCFALGLMAKPMLVTLPFVLLLFDFWPLSRFQFVTFNMPGREAKEIITKKCRGGTSNLLLLFEKVPLLILVILSCIVTIGAAKSVNAIAGLDSLSLKIRIANAVVSYISYLEKMMYPHHLAVLYPFPAIYSPWLVAGYAFMLIVITILVILFAQRYPYLIVGWLWYMGTLIPVIGLVQVGSQSMADRFAYIPLIGIFIIIAWGFPTFLKDGKIKNILLSGSAAIILIILITCTGLQLKYWQNTESLFRRAVAVTDSNFLAYNNLGAALAHQGNYGEAICQYQEALKINPRYAEAYFNLGAALAEEGKFNEAMNYYRKALQLKPNLKEAHNNLGIALANRGNVEVAILHFQKALQIDPEYSDAQKNLEVASGKKVFSES